MRQLGNATNRLRAKNYNQENSGKVPQADSEPPPPLAARAKTWTIFVKRMRQHVCIDVLSQNRRQALVTKILLWSRNQSRGCQINQIRKEPCHDLLTKNIFSSRKALHPSKRFRIRWLDGEQTAVGGAFNFRQEIFQRATVFPIRCTLQ